MSTFYVTFGQKYRHEEHPCGGHPDGWFAIEAENDEVAHEIAFEKIGQQWAFLYSEDDFAKSKGLYPRGELRRIVAPAKEVAS